MKRSELTARLRDGGIENAAGEARLLFSRFSGHPDWRLLAEDTDCPDPRLSDALARRLAREPLQYILGEAAFYREVYEVTPAVLVPRADTELLVGTAVSRLPRGAHFADLCTGSGCIAISVLVNRPDTTALAVDLSSDALAVAQRNAARNGVTERISFLCADICISVFPAFDAVLCNPPYIASSVIPTLSPEVRCEPPLALDGGEDGLRFYRSLLSRASALVRHGGFLLLEIGYDQADAVSALALEAGLLCRIGNDLGGNPRMVIVDIP